MSYRPGFLPLSHLHIQTSSGRNGSLSSCHKTLPSSVVTLDHRPS